MTTLVSIAGAMSVLLLTLELVRRRHLREKYAALWLFISVVAGVLALFPELLVSLSEFLGFGLPVNLLFFASFLVLLFVSMQLSLEVGRREDETERLAEEVALLRLALSEIPGSTQRDDEPGLPPCGENQT